LGHRIGVEVRFRVSVRVSVLKDLCDINEHQKLAYNMGGKFEILQANNKLADCTVIARLLARLYVLVGYWRILDIVLATVEVVSWSAAVVPPAVRRAPEECLSYWYRDTVLAGTYEHHCLYSKAVQGGHWSNIRQYEPDIGPVMTGRL